ncbi:MAG: class I SAM-dependent methyltransferase [Candidatus Methylomirabilales bacterium]
MHPSTAYTWDRGHRYEEYVGRWSRRVAPLFLAWLRIPAGRGWLDVGCGTGALCEAILAHGSPSRVIGVDPAQGFLQAAKDNLADRALLCRGTAVEIPLEDSAVDVVVSGLVLNFVPDPPAAVREMVRVVGGAGTIAAYVWDYAGRMELMRLFWDTAVELRPEAAREDEGVRFPLCRPPALAELFGAAGLRGVDVTAMDIPTRFASFEDYWQPFLGGQGPAPGYTISLDEVARARLRDRLQARLPVAADGSISLTARAWAVRGTVNK